MDFQVNDKNSSGLTINEGMGAQYTFPAWEIGKATILYDGQYYHIPTDQALRLIAEAYIFEEESKKPHSTFTTRHTTPEEVYWEKLIKKLSSAILFVESESSKLRGEDFVNKLCWGNTVELSYEEYGGYLAQTIAQRCDDKQIKADSKADYCNNALYEVLFMGRGEFKFSGKIISGKKLNIAVVGVSGDRVPVNLIVEDLFGTAFYRQHRSSIHLLTSEVCDQLSGRLYVELPERQNLFDESAKLLDIRSIVYEWNGKTPFVFPGRGAHKTFRHDIAYQNESFLIIYPTQPIIVYETKDEDDKDFRTFENWIDPEKMWLGFSIGGSADLFFGGSHFAIGGVLNVGDLWNKFQLNQGNRSKEAEAIQLRSSALLFNGWKAGIGLGISWSVNVHFFINFRDIKDLERQQDLSLSFDQFSFDIALGMKLPKETLKLPFRIFQLIYKTELGHIMANLPKNKKLISEGLQVVAKNLIGADNSSWRNKQFVLSVDILPFIPMLNCVSGLHLWAGWKNTNISLIEGDYSQTFHKKFKGIPEANGNRNKNILELINPDSQRN